MLDLDDYGTLIHGPANEQWLIDNLGVTPRTLRRWRRNNDAPRAVKLLLRYRNYGDLSAIGGKEWEGHYINPDGTLTLPLFPPAYPTPAYRRHVFFGTGTARPRP